MLASIGAFLSGLVAIITLIGIVIFFLIRIETARHVEDLQGQIDEIRQEICNAPSMVLDNSRLCPAAESEGGKSPKR